MAILASPGTVDELRNALRAYEEDRDVQTLRVCILGLLQLPKETGIPTTRALNCDHHVLRFPRHTLPLHVSCSCVFSCAWRSAQLERLVALEICTCRVCGAEASARRAMEPEHAHHFARYLILGPDIVGALFLQPLLHLERNRQASHQQANQPEGV